MSTSTTPTASKALPCTRGCGASGLVDEGTSTYTCPRCSSGTDPHRDRKPTDERTANDAPVWMQGDDAQSWAAGYNAAIEALGDMYVVAWSGGYEQPSFFCSRNRAEAKAKFDEWVADCKPEDRVDMISVSLDGSKTTELATGPVMDDDDEDGVGM